MRKASSGSGRSVDRTAIRRSVRKVDPRINVAMIVGIVSGLMSVAAMAVPIFLAAVQKSYGQYNGLLQAFAHGDTLAQVNVGLAVVATHLCAFSIIAMVRWHTEGTKLAKMQNDMQSITETLGRQKQQIDRHVTTISTSIKALAQSVSDQTRSALLDDTPYLWHLTSLTSVAGRLTKDVEEKRFLDGSTVLSTTSRLDTGMYSRLKSTSSLSKWTLNVYDDDDEETIRILRRHVFMLERFSEIARERGDTLDWSKLELVLHDKPLPPQAFFVCSRLDTVFGQRDLCLQYARVGTGMDAGSDISNNYVLELHDKDIVAYMRREAERETRSGRKVTPQQLREVYDARLARRRSPASEPDAPASWTTVAVDDHFSLRRN